MVRVILLEDGFDPGGQSQDYTIAILYANGKLIIRHCYRDDIWDDIDEVLLSSESNIILKEFLENSNRLNMNTRTLYKKLPKSFINDLLDQLTMNYKFRKKVQRLLEKEKNYIKVPLDIFPPKNRS